jgi:hypothetical protein
MATTTKVLSRTAAATSSATLYTTPAATSAVVTNIIVTNTAGAAANVTIALNGTVLLPAVSVAPNSIASFDLKQVLNATNTITGFATATTVNFHISGIEIA